MPSKSSGSAKIFWPQFSRAELVQLLAERLRRLTEDLPLLRVVLFGSYAKGNYTAGSDVDLLVIYRGPPRPDAYKLIWRTLQIPRLELHLYSEEEYLSLKETVDRMCQPGVVLYPPHPFPLPYKEKVKSRGRGNDLKFSFLPTRGEGKDEGGR